ncbi:hypothetical protein C4D60_Mb04t19290 [Musa balbisiana]|uniref:START domain-containing protein n=1 Tax=Musa balbisiana TaxID=52838 RepID=A0A4V6T4S2_MUSBA|nr:hypothetical protein C4D60_Mb04t19290 [Musa balbisiana]
MGLVVDALTEVLRKPTMGGVVAELAILAAPLWIAALVGLLLGWAWRPRWATGIAAGGEKAADSVAACSPPSDGLGRPSLDQPMASLLSCSGGSSVPQQPDGEKSAVTEKDLQHLCQLVEMTDGGPAWRKMMEKSLPNMSYQAWQRDPQTGPPQYRSSSVFEDATPEMVRDFFWDDEFRMKNGWDDMLLQHSTLEECPSTGSMVVQWVRKFPFFCSDREYIIGRRIWQSDRSYYCVTKGVPCSSVPRHNKPRRVDLYYSSWCIRPVASKRDGQMTACEVLLFHHEDMGIPWEIAKLGVRQGMWGCVKKVEPGFRAYQIARTSNEPVSQSSSMAQITTKFDADHLRSFEDNPVSSSDVVEVEKQKHWACNIPKFLVVGGAVALTCTLDRGLVTKAVIFGVARRFAKPGKRL